MCIYTWQQSRMLMDVIDTKIYRTRPATTLNTQLALVFPTFSRALLALHADLKAAAEL